MSDDWKLTSEEEEVFEKYRMRARKVASAFTFVWYLLAGLLGPWAIILLFGFLSGRAGN